ncbi:transposase [Gordonia sp. LSe1-13]|uniref:Transposase n=1 Tax=Gordonia sesuvii TaxID=3116777 RepID=A0ABU7MFF5_9ACTN|nr:transposase [Gordonia sp. LSe1-13]
MRGWLPDDDPVWLVISLVERIDTSVLDRLRKTGGVGRRGYDPQMMLTLLIWGWAHGQRSSRQLERLCRRDIAFRVICGGDGPDHVNRPGPGGDLGLGHLRDGGDGVTVARLVLDRWSVADR